jgi:hypothetical protein
LDFDKILNFLRAYWYIWIIWGAAVLWAGSLLLVRRVTLKRLAAALGREEARADDLKMPLPDPRPEDQEALSLIRDYRRRRLLKLWPNTRLRFREINELSQNLVTDIARIYYPEEERPELKASLGDLAALYRRVGVRLSAWLTTAAFRPLKDMELGTVLFLHGTYQRVKAHPVHQFLQRTHLYQMARWLWTSVNVVNPYYWGSRAAYTGGREVLVRLFLAKVIAVVGEEAMRLYSRRSPQARLFQRFQVGVQEMINLALEKNGELPAGVAAALLRLILAARALEDQEKLLLVKMVSRPRPRATAWGDLDPAAKKKMQRWLTGLVKFCWPAPERRELLTRLEARRQDAANSLKP